MVHKQTGSDDSVSGREHFLDTLPFEWTRPEARELKSLLSGVLFQASAVLELAQEAGIKPAAVNWQQPMDVVWHDLINQARNQGLLWILLERAAERIGAANELRLRELLRGDPVIEAPGRSDTDRPWIGFGDAGREEAQIFSTPSLLDIAFLRRGVELAPAVVRLLVGFPGGRTYYGTGFRIGEDQLLTNRHVLYDELNGVPAVKVDAWFGYENDFSGKTLAHAEVSCRPETIVAGADLDWAVVRVGSPMPVGTPLIALSGVAEVSVGDRVYIIQHPGGRPKQIGMHHNMVRFKDARVLQYWTDTEPGSSGAPVFDERWNLVGLHHRAVEVRGGSSVESRNQAVNIHRVIEDLQRTGLV